MGLCSISSGAQNVVAESDPQPIDMSDFQIVRAPITLQIDFKKTSETDLIRFLKGEYDIVDSKNKVIYRYGDQEAIGDAVKEAVKNAFIDEIFRTHQDRMSHPGPPHPTKPVEKLTESDIKAYEIERDKFLKEDEKRRTKILGLLDQLKELGYANEAEFVKTQLNALKNSNKQWLERQPVNITIQQVEE